MDVPVLRETVALSRLAGIAVPVGAVVSFHEGGVDRVTDGRAFQGRLHRRCFPKHHPQVDSPVRAWKSCTSNSVFWTVRLPGTTLKTSRGSGSYATWSQWSPRCSSAGSPSRQCFSFLPTNAHFSSHCTSRVEGGKGHQLVMELLGMSPGGPGVAGYRIPVYLDQPAGLSHATTFRNVVQQGNQFLGRQLHAKQRRAFPLRKSLLTRAAVQQAKIPVLPKPSAHRQVARPPFAVIRTRGILTTKSRKIFHDYQPPNTTPLDNNYVAKVVEVRSTYSISSIIVGHEARMPSRWKSYASPRRLRWNWRVTVSCIASNACSANGGADPRARCRCRIPLTETEWASRVAQDRQRCAVQQLGLSFEVKMHQAGIVLRLVPVMFPTSVILSVEIARCILVL